MTTLEDNKLEFEGQPDLETAQKVFKRTLATLESYVEQHEAPSVVAISGDISVKADQSGFDAFFKLLSDSALLADPSKIVVVPGNHDVVWGTPPGSRARYERFLGATRAKDCITPLLDGVDFDPEDDGASLREGLTPQEHLFSDDDLLVVPINSSNYCGSSVRTRGGWDAEEWAKQLEPLEDGEALKQVKKLLQHDIARVSKSQLQALGNLFDAAGESRSRKAGDDRLRVAVLHHQLLPVSNREERKTFESIANLGLVRDTLRDYEIDLVLHGHKHEGRSYWDIVPAGGLSSPGHKMLILSAPGHANVGYPVMTALHLEGIRSARSISITSVLGAGPNQQRPRLGDPERAELWIGQMERERSERSFVRAASTAVAYARLQRLGETEAKGRVRNLVCQVDDPGDAMRLPDGYPSPDGGLSAHWFEDMVAWWQRERSELVDRGLVDFNHGERIRHRWGDQVKRAAQLLKDKPSSSRAVIQLVAPEETGRYEEDARSIEKSPFPAFVLAELGICRRSDGDQLDCFGYFRKQEMRYWWPVNVAELASIRDSVLTEIGRADLKPGRITTFAAIALWANDLPKVAVPELDRLVDEPGRIWGLAAALGDPLLATERVREDWSRVLADLAGHGRKHPPRPKLGLKRLFLELERVEALRPGQEIATVKQAVEALLTQLDVVAVPPNAAGVKAIQRAVEALRIAVAARPELATAG